ncbi:MAG: glycosyltransferase [Nitrospiraceae bacterium]
MRIVLINSPSLAHRPVSRSMAGGLGFDGSEYLLLPPLDLAIMASTLRQAGESVELIDADPLRLDARAVFARLGEHAWDVLIATVSLPTLNQDAAFIAELRRRHPQAKVVGKTLVRDRQVLKTFLETSGADLVIHGEVDLSIADLVHGRSRSGTAWLEIQESGVPIVRFDAGEPVGDLNRLPFPARDLLPNSRYVYPLLGSPVATLQTSRGCPYPCGYYCPYPLVEGVKWRSQSPERIAAELKEVVEQLGINKIYFRDATFTLNQERIVRLCDLIIAAGWQLEWMCETRVDCLGDRVLEKMRAAGCVGILIGVESGDERVMHHRDGKKGLTVPKLAHLRARTRQLGIRLHFLLIIGLPLETRQSIVGTYDLIQRYHPDTIGVTIITPYPGTPLYDEGLREGWIDSLQWQDYGGHQVVMHTPNLSREDLVQGKRFVEDGFAILQQGRNDGAHAASRETVAEQHYMDLLRWAYHLEGPITEWQQLARSVHPDGSTGHMTQFRGQESRPDPLPPAPGTHLVSVIIPTYNRRAILRKTLLAFTSQTIPPEQFEVIVVDDGSGDETVAMLRSFQASFRLRILTQAHQGANAARNLGIHTAQGDLVLLTGDDMIPEPAFLESHLKFHRQHPSELIAMLGFIDWSPEIAVTPFMRFIVSPEGGQQFAFHEVKNGQADFRLFYTSNISMKRSLLLKQQMLFDPQFTYPAYDDIELGFRLARQGMQLHYNAVAVTCHHHAVIPEGFVGRQRKAGRMAVVLAGKHPELGASLLGIEDITRYPERYQESTVNTLLKVLMELEKPDLNALRALRTSSGGFDTVYQHTVMYPLYALLLQTAYALGVLEGMRAAAENRPSHVTMSSSKPCVASIIIPVFNKVELTQQCLVHLAKTTTHIEYEVIIVDNASTDDTAGFLATLSGDVQIIRNAQNVGFAKACNQGARAAKGRYLVFLNNDTIPCEGWLTALVDEVETHLDTAVVGSKLLYPDGTIQHAGVVFSREGLFPYHVYRGVPADLLAVNRRREFQCVTAACLLVRPDIFNAVGGFDEGYRNGFEDVDFCLKIRKRGGHIIYQPQSVLYHLESQSPGRKSHEEHNSRRLVSQWGHQWWITDEDGVYFADGYVQRVVTVDGRLKGRIEPLDPAERRPWQCVATAQRLAQGQDITQLARLLAAPQEWPHDISVWRWAARLCGLAGSPELAEPFWKLILDCEEMSDARCGLAQAALEQGRLDEAEDHLNVLYRHHSRCGEGWMLRGVLATQRQSYDEATFAFETALAYGGDSRKARMGSGMASIGQGRHEQAWDVFSALLDQHPDDAEGVHWLLRTGAALERWEGLMEPLARFLQRNPADLSVRFALAGVSVRLERWDLARREYETIKLLNPAYDGLNDLAKALTKTDACAAH